VPVGRTCASAIGTIAGRCNVKASSSTAAMLRGNGATM
jgi:hypothetical protein